SHAEKGIDLLMEVISKQDAKAKGLKFYFTGKPCPKGHYSERRVSNGACEDCLRAWALARYHQNSERYLAANKEWKKQNRERVLETRIAYYMKNKDREAAYAKAWREAHPEKVKQWRIDFR